MQGELTLIQHLAVAVLPILFAITVHEWAHGWVASCLGDPTARILGRLTLNPLKHIDPIGTIMVPIVLVWLTGFLFGWAKPVPITWQNLRNPRRDVALVAIAGPIANLCMGVAWAFWLKLAPVINSYSANMGLAMKYMGLYGVSINILLLLLNLIPLPPLDGSRVVSSLLPKRWAYYYNQIEPYGFFILLFLLLSGVLSHYLFSTLNTILTLVISAM